MRTGFKRVIQGLLDRCGYHLVRLPSDLSKKHHEIVEGSRIYEAVTPQATYAPWNGDPLFEYTFDLIKAYTLVDVLRCWELWTLVEQSTKLEGDIIEIGVWRGGTGSLMAKKAELCGIQNLIYLCDTFTGVVKAGSNDTCYNGGEHADTSRQFVERLVEDVMKLSNVVVLEGIFPEESGAYLESRDARFRLCHIDVDVYQSAKDILNWVWRRMVVGGIVVYDDYGFETCKGITRFVNEQIGIKDRLVLHNLNGHAIVIKTASQ
jgi:O-methyltransferase